MMSMYSFLGNWINSENNCMNLVAHEDSDRPENRAFNGGIFKINPLVILIYM